MIDVLSKQKGLSRSRYIFNVLCEKVMFEKERALKKKFNKVFSDVKISKEQLNTSKWFEGSDVMEARNGDSKRFTLLD